MQYSVTIVVGFLLMGWSSSSTIPSQVKFESEPEVLKTDSNNGTLVFAHVVSKLLFMKNFWDCHQILHFALIE